MIIRTKICGLSTKQAVEAADAAGAPFLGFVFCDKSPRNISPKLAGEISAYVMSAKVAVTVNASDELLEEIILNLQPDFIQLHGNETDEHAAAIKAKFGLPLIRACVANKYPNSNLYEYILIDSPEGGSGKQFNYSNFIAPETDWFLSGGLTPNNVADAIAKTGAKMVDVSSGVESEKGVKDIGLIEDFLKVTNEYTN
jgi:phosphoribosylanthranilate isomerase